MLHLCLHTGSIFVGSRKCGLLRLVHRVGWLFMVHRAASHEQCAHVYFIKRPTFRAHTWFILIYTNVICCHLCTDYRVHDLPNAHFLNTRNSFETQGLRPMRRFVGRLERWRSGPMADYNLRKMTFENCTGWRVHITGYAVGTIILCFSLPDRRTDRQKAVAVPMTTSSCKRDSRQIEYVRHFQYVKLCSSDVFLIWWKYEDPRARKGAGWRTQIVAMVSWCDFIPLLVSCRTTDSCGVYVQLWCVCVCFVVIISRNQTRMFEHVSIPLSSRMDGWPTLLYFHVLKYR